MGLLVTSLCPLTNKAQMSQLVQLVTRTYPLTSLGQFMNCTVITLSTVPLHGSDLCEVDAGDFCEMGDGELATASS